VSNSADEFALTDGIGVTEVEQERPGHGSFTDPRILVPFIVITLIWGPPGS
jgi:hypothetical protein